MESREDRWFVRFRGHTLGPLTSDQVKISLGKKELGPDDKLASAREPSWRALSEFPEFLHFWESLGPVSSDLVVPPSPQVLWRKKKAPLPVAPPAASPLPAITETFEPKLAPPTAAKPKAAAARKKVPVKVKPRQRPQKKAAPPPEQEEAPQAPLATAPRSIEPQGEGKRETLFLEPALSESPKSPADLAKETLTLLDSLREWSHKEKESAQRFRPEDHFPNKPLIPETPQWVPPSRAFEPKAARPQKIELHLTLSKKFLLVFTLIAMLAAAAIVMVVVDPQKMRGLDGFRLPDPSSPTNEPSAKNDPIPSLKAPTRPKRD